MNRRALAPEERGLILLLAAALMVSGIVLLRPSGSPTSSTPSVDAIVLENVRVLIPTFDARRSRININSATEEELATLPGIGEVLARRIVAHREAHGGFTRIDRLIDVSGIGEVLLSRLRDHVTLDD